MIDIAQPAFGLNDRAGHHVHVQMRNTWDVPSGTSADRITSHVAAVARAVPGGKFRNIVFSCHGAPAAILIGQGIRMGDVGLFSRWRGLVDKIWIRCCQVANIAGTGPAATNNGNAFCSRIAQEAGAYVVASTHLQVADVGRELPYGQLDTFEGVVLSYGPAGNVTWRHSYPVTQYVPPRLWGIIPENWTQNPD